MAQRPINPAYCERGATMVEFAAVLPIYVMLLLAGFDISYQLYLQSVLEGEIAKAGRDSALETGGATVTQTAIDDQVEAGIAAVAPGATVVFQRQSFASYGGVASNSEPLINDANGNGLCDAGDTYEDLNRNGSYNATGAGTTGFTGAKDAIVYTATASYPRLFPMASLLGWSNQASVSATTMLKIQPFNAQAAVPMRTCA